MKWKRTTYKNINMQYSETSTLRLDRALLAKRVKEVYTQVASNPKEPFHFETGRTLAERLGYPAYVLNKIPSKALESFSGVGYFFHMPTIEQDSSIVDLGSGSGTDVFFAALLAGPAGDVTGIDMTDMQLEKSSGLAKQHGFSNVSFVKSYIESLPLGDNSADVVISNGVINLSADKEAVFSEVARILKPGGQLVLSDIVSAAPLPVQVTGDADLWAACVGGALPLDQYAGYITNAGLRVLNVETNLQYMFLSQSAQHLAERYGIRSISLLAEKNFIAFKTQ